MTSKADMRHWLDTIWAMAPLARFFNMVPVNGEYVAIEPNKERK